MNSSDTEYHKAIKQIATKRDPSSFAYVFLVGAGASVSSGIMDGRRMSEALMAEFDITDEQVRAKRDEVPGLTYYQAIMSLCQDRCTESWISQYIRDLIRAARRPSPDNRWIINNCYDTLANILVENDRLHFSRVVLTTNFDPLLSYAFIQNWHHEPLLIRHPEEVGTMQPEKVYGEFPVILYLHGYWQNHAQYNQPNQINKYADAWRGRLEGHFVRDVIVIGYSGTEDSIALRWLRDCLAHRGSRVWWCMYTPDGRLEVTSVDTIRRMLNYTDPLGDSLRFIPIRGADEFMLDLGKELGLRRAADISCAKRVFEWYRPSTLSVFDNGAKLTYRTDDALEITIHSGADKFPGNNHAGLNMDTILHDVNLSGYEFIEMHYSTATSKVPQKAAGFEFKLHSPKNAWSYHLPFLPTGGSHLIPLAEFTKNKVDLAKIWRIVIAADVNCLGKGGQGVISISKANLIPANRKVNR